MRALKLILLAILSGLLLGASWFSPFTWLAFVAFVPLLVLTHRVEHSHIKRKKLTVFLLAYLTFIIWNVFDTWWIWYASDGGAVAAFVANSLLMALTYLLFFTLYRRVQRWSYSVWILPPVWLAFEYLHTKWDLAWTWLTLGNVFAFEHNWVQWYEFTGVSGGTLWILIVNILLYTILKTKFQESKIRMAAVVLIVLIPIGISRAIISTSSLQTDSKLNQQVLIVQPNIDPYNDK